MGATKKSQINSTTTYPKSKLNKNSLVEKNLEKSNTLEADIGTSVDSNLIKSKPVSRSSIEKKLETVKTTTVQKSKSNKLLKSSSNSELVKSTKLIATKKQCSTTVKPVEKSKAINKMLKSLDIKITGYPNFLSENKIVDCSISENVKTKYRAVKTSSGPSLNFKNSTKRDELLTDVEKASAYNLDDECDTKIENILNKELNTTISGCKANEIIPDKEKDHSIPKFIDKLPENCAMGRKSNEIVLKPAKKSSNSATTKKSKTEKADTKTGKLLSSKSNNNNADNSSSENGKPQLKDSTTESTLPLVSKDSTKKTVRKYVKKSSAEKVQGKSQEKETKSSLKTPKNISKKNKEQSTVKNIPNESEKQNTEKTNLSNSILIKDKKIVKKSTVKKEKSSKTVNENKKDSRNVKTKPDEQKFLNKEMQQVTSEMDTKLENVIKVKKDVYATDVAQNTVEEKEDSNFDNQHNSKINNVDNEVYENKSKDDKATTCVEQKKKQKEDSTAINVEIKTNKTADQTSDETEPALEKNKEQNLEEETKLGAKFQTVRERLQKKYVTTSKANLETNKSQLPKLSAAQKKSSQSMNSGEPNKSSKESEMDIYDFKSESEAEETIKMNLLDSILNKLDDNESDVEKEPTRVNEKDSNINTNEPVTTSEIKLAVDKIKEVKKKKPEKKVMVKSVVPKKKVIKPKSGTESDSENEPSSKKRKKVVFVQKRHRMASLNALAKVQCLYENESRTAHELGLSKTMQIPKIRTIQSGESSEDEKNDKKSVKAIKDLLIENNDKKKLTEKNKDLVEDVDDESEKSEAEEEIYTKRELRNVPGFRGTGWHYDFNDCSSYESADESDASYRQEGEVSKSKSKKKKLQKMKVVKVIKSKFSKIKVTKKSEKAKLKKKKSQLSCDEDSENSSIKKEPIEKSKKKKIVYKKRKHKDEYLLTLKGLARKRMAGLNASAIVAATYELEGHLDRNLNSECSSYDSVDEKKKQKNNSLLLKKSKESKKDISKTSTIVEDLKESKDPKESSRPTSSSVVIVQDTDVTITGVYVNSSTGSSQEAYCKMQYRVQSSVTEERVLRPNSIDPPPKSYTPLGALSSMLPPSTTNDGQQTNQSVSTIQAPISTVINQQQQQQQQHLQQPIQQSTEQIGGSMYGAQGHLHHSHSLQQQQLQHHHHHHSQHPDNTAHIYPPPHPISSSHIGHYGNGMSYDNSQYQYHHLNSGNVGSLPQHLQHHLHHYPQQQPPSRCDSPSAMQYHLQSPQNQGNGYQQSGIMGPPPPLSASGLGGAQSAFCAPNLQQQQQSHHDLSGSLSGFIKILQK